MTDRIQEWADAIAERISDEWAGKFDFPEDAQLLMIQLSSALAKCPEECMNVIGTGVIEESYFDPII